MVDESRHVRTGYSPTPTALGVAILAVLGGACATVRAGHFGAVTLDLASRVVYIPKPSAALSEPAVRAQIAQCEHEGRPHCRELWRPGNARTRFSRLTAETVYVFVSLSGVEPNREYAVTVRWLRPDGGLQLANVQRFHTPNRVSPGLMLETVAFVSAANMVLGEWRIQILINDKLEGERTFEVVDVPIEAPTSA
jgi:hypothetical protein